jgi:hypothetical protein
MRTMLIAVFVTVCTGVVVAQPICDFQGKDSLAVEVIDDRVAIWDLSLCGNCASAFAVTVLISNDTINIVQRDTVSLPALCDCLFDLRVSISGFPAGSYTAVVYRDFRLMYPWTAVRFVGSIQFLKEPGPPPDFSFSVYQSGCHPTSIERASEQPPKRFALSANYPNPFNPSTVLECQIPEARYVAITVLDVLGREVQPLSAGYFPAGVHTVRFDASPELSSGVYYCRMVAGSFCQVRAMTLIR